MTGKLRWLAGFMLGRLILLSLHGVRITALMVAVLAAAAGAALAVAVHPAFGAVTVVVAAGLVPLVVRAWQRSAPAQTGEREPWDTPTQPLPVVVAGRLVTPTVLTNRPAPIRHPEGLPFGMAANPRGELPPQPWFDGPTLVLPHHHANLGDNH